MKQCIKFMMAAIVLVGCTTAWAASDADLQAQVEALQNRVAELEAQQSSQSVEQRNAELIKQLMSEMANDPHGLAQDTAITAGYDKGFFIKSSDDQFKLQIGTQLQVRHSYLKFDEGSTSVNSSASNAELERAKVILKGHVMKDLKYKIQFDADDDNSDNSRLQEYEISYSFMPEFGVKAGRFKGPFSRQELVSSSRQMMVDRGLANEVFTISRTSGAAIFGELPVADEKVYYTASISNGFKDEYRMPIADYDNNPAVAGRLALPLMGATPDDFANESDLMYHDNPVAQIGIGFGYNNAKDEQAPAVGFTDEDRYAVLVRGQDGCIYQDYYAETSMVTADFAFKYQGLSVLLDGYYQHNSTDRDISGWVAGSDTADPADDVFSDGYQFDNYGFNAQAGYFIVPKSFELTSRIGGVCVDNAGTTLEYAGGWNYYISGQDLKLSMDVTYIDDALPITESTSNYYGIEGESVIMVRTQLQFQF